MNVSTAASTIPSRIIKLSLYIITLITTDDIFFYSLLVKSSYLVILAWVAICLTSNLSLRRR